MRLGDPRSRRRRHRSAAPSVPPSRRPQELDACRRPARRARASRRGRARAARSACRCPRRDPRLRARRPSPSTRSRTHALRRRPSAARRCSALPAARGRRECRPCCRPAPACRSARRRRRRRAAARPSTDTTRSCSRARPPRGSTGAASATGRGRCRAPSARSRRSRADRRAAASLRRLPAGAAEHRSHRGQNLAELVVQLARDLAAASTSRVGDQLLRQLAALRPRATPSSANSRRLERIRYRLVSGDRDERRRRNQ